MITKWIVISGDSTRIGLQLQDMPGWWGRMSVPVVMTRSQRVPADVAYIEAAADRLLLESAQSHMRLQRWPRLAAESRPRPATAGERWQPCTPRVSLHAAGVHRGAGDPALLERGQQQGLEQLQLPLEELAAAPPCSPTMRAWERRRLQAAWGWFWEPLPGDVRRSVARYAAHHWGLLRLAAAEGPAALDLMQGNPALALLLSLSPPDGPVLVRGRTQRDLLALLGWPATEAARKLLARVPCEAATVRLLHRMARALVAARPAARLAHLSRINLGAVALVSDPTVAEHVTPRLLAEVCHAPAEDRQARSSSMLKALHQWRSEYPELDVPLRFDSRSDLQTAHQTIQNQHRERSLFSRVIEFRPPPVAGTDAIEPLRTNMQLLEEGRKQHNCAREFVSLVVGCQHYYMYRMLKPERCTLAVRQVGGLWLLDQIRAACNGEASRMAVNAAREWLNQAQRDALNAVLAEQPHA